MSTIPHPTNDLDRGFATLEISPTPAETEVENISAIHRIPTEILCQIFTLTYTRRVGDYITEEVPWRLGHICRVWRAAALGYPSLWSSITLDISLHSNGQIGHACPPLMVETQLLRSGTAPLHVSFHTRYTTIVEVGHHRALDLILHQSFRWEIALLRLGQIRDPLFGNRLRTVKGKVPMLRHLQLIDCHKDIVGDAFSIAPSLRAVVLTPDDGPQTASINSTVLLPWSQITKFRGSYFQSQDCATVFNAARNLVECGMLSYSPHPSNGSHILLPRLLRLAMYGFILNIVTAPSLRELWTSWLSDTSGNTPVPLMVDFIQRSSCRLEKLVMYGCSSPEALIPALRAMPTLKKLFVSFAKTADYTDQQTLFDALKMSGGPAGLCPHLTHIAAGGPQAFAVESFLDMVQSRPALSFIRAFYIEDLPERLQRETESAVVWINEKRSEGLDVALAARFSPLSRQSYMSMGRP
ncbi:hypothetical protein DFH08DRAFT_439309 [Mycena albidolilacea]|uniref:F-box domain-containing protein n=1 Tax=Mycena albidolilacea TaxID=1033008 RepID=A0AAD7EYF4_9AGAR|nr:hypothetical protein DFH08DRAFT_439309 [Mycena albidolilacea]